MKALFKNIIDAPAATIAGAIIAALAAITSSGYPIPEPVSVVIMVVAAFLAAFSGPNKPDNEEDTFNKLSVILWVLCVSSLCLPSCQPTAYVADLRTYAEPIKANPEAVVLKPEHVTPIGGISTDIRGSIVTDQGTIGISDGVVYTDLVIDATAGK